MEPEHTRTRYRIDPTEWEARLVPAGVTLRPIHPDDEAILPALLLDGYAGTIDDEDGTIDDAIDEVVNWFAGSALLEHSRLLFVDDQPAAACLVDVYEDAPWIAYVFTAAAHKRQGLGRVAVDAAVVSLADAGHRNAGLLITDGNTGSERIFAQATPIETR